MFSSFGTDFATRSASAYVSPMARPVSRIAAFAPSVPKVMIWATRSSPYLSVT
jgi:hypothetical protein